MKNIFNIIFLSLLGLNVSAQIRANLILNNRPPSYLSDWGDARAGQLVINYTSPAATQVLEIVISTKILNEVGEVVAKTNPNLSKSILINTATQIIRLDRVLQLENMTFSPALEKGIDPLRYFSRSGKLPPGVYTLVIELFQAKSGKLLEREIQRRFTQSNYILPFLLSPQNEAWLDANTAQTAIIFRWSSLIPISQEIVKYRLNVFEILPDQSPMQALRSNMPILDTEIIRQTQYIWRPQLDFKTQELKTYIWTVQSLDGKGEIISTIDQNTQGRSEPRVFGICNSKETNKILCGSYYKWNPN